jgi:hypothetical protein
MSPRPIAITGQVSWASMKALRKIPKIGSKGSLPQEKGTWKGRHISGFQYLK